MGLLHGTQPHLLGGLWVHLLLITCKVGSSVFISHSEIVLKLGTQLKLTLSAPAKQENPQLNQLDKEET